MKMSKRAVKKTEKSAERPSEKPNAKHADKIVIDEAKNLIFDNEEALYRHFFSEISTLEKEFFAQRPDDDIAESDFDRYENNLNLLLENPDEIWYDTEALKGVELNTYIKKFKSEDNEQPLYHVAVVYLTDSIPSFVYLHFPTQSDILVAKYRRGEKTYDRMNENIPFGAIDGDALHEGDDFARGLYSAMMKVRAESDIKEEEFRRFGTLREETIEQPDEIWRSNDSMGNVLVSFVKEYPDEGEQGLHYVVVTLEDMPSNSHALLFSFPSTDEALVGRYRHGENLQAEEVVQEASH
jgi:phage-Barnase-EndoU-ColicinE5/D-RelE like nuclease2